MKAITILSLLLIASISSLKAQLSENYKDYIKRSTQENPTKLLLEIEDADTTNKEYHLLKAELNYYAGNNELALQLLEAVIIQLTQTNEQKSHQYARALSNKGLILWNEGKSKQAESYLKEALVIQKSISADELTRSETYNNLGLITKNENPPLAKEYFEKAFSLIEKKDELIEKKVYISINLALLDIEDKSFTNALRRLNNVLESWRELHNEKLPIEAFILLNLGEIYQQLDNYVLASDYIGEAIEIYTYFYGNRNSELANAYMLLSRLLLKQNKYAEALAINQKALIANSLKFNDLDVSQNPTTTDAIKESYQMAILMEKARIYEKFYFGFSLKKNHLIRALVALDAADELVNSLRNNTANKVDQLALNINASKIYESGQRIAIYLDDISLLEKGYLKRAFEYSEKAKASGLLNAVTESNAKAFANIPATTLQEESKLKNHIAYYATALAKASTSDDQISIQTQLFNAQKLYEDFVKKLEKEYPAYYNLKFNSRTATISDIQASLPTDALLISYGIDEENQQIYQYTIGKDHFKVSIIYNLAEVQRLIKAYRNILTYKIKSPYQAISHDLFESLFPNKIKSHIKRIIIIPEAELGVIPFEALTVSLTESEDFKDFHYMIKKFALSYDYSATLRSNISKVNTYQKTLVIAPVNFNDSEINSLPASEEEANVISDLFESNDYNNVKLTFNEATESNFRKQYTTGYDFIHLATHGLVNPQNPDLSAIYLNSENSGSNDGRLYVGEIYNLNLKSNLLCLSACETGIGKYSKGEGILGLGRAFSYAGANQIMVSLWKVSDNSTSTLMQNFYKNSLKNKDRDYVTGLQAAKTTMINSPNSNPFYWAPFVLWGK